MVGMAGPIPLILDRMKTRADFLRAQKSGWRQSRGLIGLELVETPFAARRAGALRLGVTASRKVGGAVERNRAKRRLRAAAAALLPLSGREGHDYVLIARAATVHCPFTALVDDLGKGLAALHRKCDATSPGREARDAQH
jgi:ribonuclease P protein component